MYTAPEAGWWLEEGRWEQEGERARPCKLMDAQRFILRTVKC